MEKKVKIAIIGGSFDPPTMGHIQLAELCAKHFDYVWITPCFWHQQKNIVASDRHRLNMLQIIKFKNKNIDINSFEIDLKLDGKTYNSISFLKELYSDNIFKKDFYLVFGSDNINNIKSYYEYEKLINENKFCIVERKGYIAENIELFKNNSENVFLENNNDIIEISSSEIRNSLYNNLIPNEDYLDKRVLKYITKNNLYK